jgi:hypothetical protein
MKNVIALAFALALMAASPAAAQSTTTPSKAQVEADVQKALENKKMLEKIEEAARQNPRFVRTLTNVQVELTLTDQIGNGAPEKKIVSMIVSSGNWGKIRNTAAGVGPVRIGLNVDARPFVSVDGPVQLELTIYYYPPQGEPKSPGVPTELNQSLTVVLQSGKPMLISQAADPTSDRKVTIEAKATVLK